MHYNITKSKKSASGKIPPRRTTQYRSREGNEMIGLIYGPKGSGKTKEILRRANDALEVSKGNIVYITDTAEYTRSIPTAIRYVNAAE